MDEHLRNPAGRLYLLLVALREGEATRPLVDAFVSYFGLTDGYSPEVFEALGRVARLPAQARKAIGELQNSPIPPTDMLDGLTEAERTIESIGQNSLSMQVIQATNLYTDSSLTLLKMASYMINAEGHVAPEVTEADLAAIKTAAEELKESVVSSSDIDPRLARVLLHHVSAFVATADLYRVVGVEAVLDEFDRLLGKVQRDSSVRDQFRRAPKEVALGFFKLMAAVGVVVNALHGVYQLRIDAIEMLGIEAPATSVQAPAEHVDSPRQSALGLQE